MDMDSIACVETQAWLIHKGATCMFLQSTETGLMGSDILELAEDLVDHGVSFFSFLSLFTGSVEVVLIVNVVS